MGCSQPRQTPLLPPAVPRRINSSRDGGLREDARLEAEEELAVENGGLPILPPGIGESRPCRKRGSVGDSGGPKNGGGRGGGARPDKRVSYSFSGLDGKRDKVFFADGGLECELLVWATEVLDAAEDADSVDVWLV